MSATFSPFDAAALLIVAAAVLGYANHRWLRLPASVGLTVMGALASLLVLGIDRLMPSSQLAAQFNAFLGQLDFHRTLMEGMLSFLLFAGALHVDWSHMRAGRWPIIIFSTVGVLISTLVVGLAFWLVAGWMGLAVPLAWALVFGALISPTDPVAVMAVAGLVIGNAGVAHAMSDVTQDYLLKFWALIDEILNAVLFLLIGLEVIAIAPHLSLVMLGVISIALVLAGRIVSVGVPLALMRRMIDMGPLALPTLVWGGLRGGISVALALSLPDSPIRSAILAATYIVVLFAVIVQGGSIGALIERIKARHGVTGVTVH